eukprot:7386955-Prymnesium_polylepis.3
MPCKGVTATSWTRNMILSSHPPAPSPSKSRSSVGQSGSECQQQMACLFYACKAGRTPASRQQIGPLRFAIAG